MNLLIDVGNTNIVLAIYGNEKWLYKWRIHTVKNKTADEYEVILRSLLDKHSVNPKLIIKTVISTVVPSLLYPMQRISKELTGKEAIILEPSLYESLPISILNPYEIGTDLVADSLAAYHKYKRNCIVVDFGTALTFTTISSSGEILGVNIAPGVKTAIKALANNTAQLPEVPLKQPSSILAKNTVHAIQTGVIYGVIGIVEYIVSKIKIELDEDVVVIATGGLSQLVENLTDIFDFFNPNLTIEGLRIIAEKYS